MTLSAARRFLLILFWSFVALSLAVLLLYEAEVITDAPIGEDPQLAYLSQIVSQLATIVCIPLALRLFKFAAVMRRLHQSPAALRTWGSLRILTLCVPLLLNTLLYEQTQMASFGYLAAILLLCLLFVYPSQDRCRADISTTLTPGDE